jgi:hypothetical protein
MLLRQVKPLLCVLALALPAALASCANKEEHPGTEEPAREGLALEMQGVEYTVFITRQLNPKVAPDEAYVSDEPAEGDTYYGVFMQVCNRSEETRQPATTFFVRDNQDEAFEPKQLPADNPFGYQASSLDPDECIPQAGSVAQLGPSTGSMLLFELPLENTENRPLELEIRADDGESRTVELDI